MNLKGPCSGEEQFGDDDLFNGPIVKEQTEIMHKIKNLIINYATVPRLDFKIWLKSLLNFSKN